MTTVAKNINDEILISIYLKRDKHENGMTLQQYADGVLAGTQPILGHAEFVYQFGATDDDLDNVVAWAERNGLTVSESHHGQSVVKVTGTVGTFNNLFNITLQDVTDGERTYMMPDGDITIPSEIADVVESVPGFDQSFLAVKHAVKFEPQSVDPNVVNPFLSAVTPIQMATAYKVPAGDGNGGCIGIFELTYSGYVTGYSTSDVTSSFTRIGLTPPTIVQVNVDGATASTTSDAESMLDIYCSAGMAPKAKIAYYTAPNTGNQSIIDNILAAANDTTNNPSALDISWGIGDGIQFDTALQACVAKGITVFVSSGDSGAVNLSMAATCCSQYMVSAGGTSISLDGSNNITSEVAWSGSGGGISSSVALPTWQSTSSYTTKTSAGVLGTATSLPRRGVPDISAPADPNSGFAFYVSGSLQQWGGTSASAPLLAGLWVRLNTLLGTRIPFNMTTWYTNRTTMFNDITSGDNVLSANGYTNGYTTTSGWDAVTGLGSPKADQIYKYFHTGTTFPKLNYGARPATGVAYPRRTTGAR
jgi:kumamolisin